MTVLSADIAIVGSGPAGAALAGLAAGAGARVVVLERTRFPRDRLCGEFVSAEACRALARLGVLERLRDAGATPVESVRVTDRRGREVESPFAPPEDDGCTALGISRKLLDAVLVDQARARGAQVLERVKALAPVLEDGVVRGVRFRPVGSAGRSETVRAPVVVAADGRGSVLLRALARRAPMRATPTSRIGLKAHFEGDVNRLGRNVELHLFEGGYAGIGLVEGGVLNLCTVVTAGALRACGSPDRLLRERILANPAAANSLLGAARRTAWKSTGPLRHGARCAAAAGVIFVGDAAGTVDPFCGQGIARALASAELALPHALRGAETGGLTEASAAAYRREWRASFSRPSRRARALGWLFEHTRAGSAAISLVSGLAAPLLERFVTVGRSTSRAT